MPPMPGPAVDADPTPRVGGGGFFRRRMGTAKWVGLPERRSRALPLLLAVAVLLGAAAGVVADRFVSPAQVAARARPPAASLVTEQVRFGSLPAVVQVQAGVSAGRTVTVGPPASLGGSLPVVTSVTIATGERLTAGRLLAVVAQRPVFVFAGAIPAFRVMSPGDHGPDVRELQAGLAAAGYGTGGDAAGTYGPGTTAAVTALYRAHGIRPVMSAHTGRARTLSRLVGADQAKTAAARAKLTADRRAGASHRVLAADRAKLAAARAALAAAELALAAAQRLAGAMVPLGEAAFVPRLPARVVSVARLGSTVGQVGGNSTGSSGGSLAVLATGKPTLTATANAAQAGSLRAGMTGIAVSDTSGAQARVRVLAVRGTAVTFVPAGRLPLGMVGQRVLVTVTTSQVKALIVPVAAVTTSGTGQTFVTVSRHGSTMTVAVRVGLSSGGQQAVEPVRPGALRPGDLVVLGIAVAGGGGR